MTLRGSKRSRSPPSRSSNRCDSCASPARIGRRSTPTSCSPSCPLARHETSDLERQIPLSSVFAILALIARRVKQADVPLVLAAGTQLDEMGIVGFAIMTSATGREAIARAIRFQRLISAAGSWHARGRRRSQLRLTWHRPMPLDLGHRLANEIVLAQVVHYARHLLGPFEPSSVHFRHPAPEQTKDHRQFFGCAVTFGAEHDQLVLPSVVLERSPVSANRALSEYFDALVERRVDQLPGSSVRTQVREWAATRLVDGEPDPAERGAQAWHVPAHTADQVARGRLLVPRRWSMSCAENRPCCCSSAARA